MAESQEQQNKELYKQVSVIVDKAAENLKKKLVNLISRREKQVTKHVMQLSKTSRAVLNNQNVRSDRNRGNKGQNVRRRTNRKGGGRYHSESSYSSDYSYDE